MLRALTTRRKARLEDLSSNLSPSRVSNNRATCRCCCVSPAGCLVLSVMVVYFCVSMSVFRSWRLRTTVENGIHGVNEPAGSSLQSAVITTPRTLESNISAIPETKGLSFSSIGQMLSGEAKELTRRISEPLRRHLDIVERQRQTKLLEQVFLNESVSEMRETVRRTRAFFENETVITIRGFFSTGTNWLRSLITANCPKIKWSVKLTPPYPRFSVLDVDGLYGWKHGYFLKREIEWFRQAQLHRMVIIAREAPTWIVSAWKMNAMVPTPSWYKPPPKTRPKVVPQSISKNSQGAGKVPPALPPEVFNVTQPPQFITLKEYITHHQVNESGIPPGIFHAKYFDPDIRHLYELRSASTLEARTKVYRNWLDLLKLEGGVFAPRIKFIRYEDLKDDPYKMMQYLDREFNMENQPCNLSNPETFNPVVTRVKMGMRDGAIKPQQQHHRQEFCTIVNGDDELYQAILAQVDRAFDQEILGYQYPDSLAEYCAGVH